MEDFTSTPVDERFSKRIELATKAFDTDRERLLSFYPPVDGPGINEMKEVLRTLHTYEGEDSTFYHHNKSPVNGLEYWYEDGEFKYIMYAPSQRNESLIRRQLYSHYKGCDIKFKKPYIFDINSDDYVIGGRLKLHHHYFEPIKSLNSPEGFEINPFHSIFGELDTRDDMRAIIQVLFKPAEEDWPHLNTKNVEEYAERKRNQTRTESTLFGLRKQTIEPDREDEKAADLIQNQVGKLAYYVNIRFFLVSHNKTQIENIASELANLFEIEFNSRLGQKFKPCQHQDEEDVRDEFIDTILRRPTKMRQPKRPLEYLHSTRIPGSETIIMTIPELATIASIPNKNELPIDSIAWTDKPIAGRMPQDSGFKPLTEEERKNIQEDRKRGTTVPPQTSPPDENTSSAPEPETPTPSSEPIDTTPEPTETEETEQTQEPEDTESDISSLLGGNEEPESESSPDDMSPDDFTVSDGQDAEDTDPTVDESIDSEDMGDTGDSEESEDDSSSKNTEDDIDDLLGL